MIGLNNAVLMHPRHHMRPLQSAHGMHPRAAPPPATSGYYNPAQIATAYDWPNIKDTNNGRGVTLAILTADSSGLASVPDYRYFWNVYGLPDHTVNIIPVDGDKDATDGMGETLLDMEWGGAMSPGDILNVYVASNAGFSAFTDMYNQLVVDNDAQVMTTSWGGPESSSPTETDEEIFMQAAAQGISMFAAAGDSGSGDGTGQNNMADYPAVSAYVTAANGTELRANKNGDYISEIAWNDTGGAISRIIKRPAWQVGPGVPNSNWRMNSDMAMNAGPERPYLLRYQGAWYLASGTSAVAPQFGALFTIGVSQRGRIGQSNSALYHDVNAGHYKSDFRDVTAGSNGAYEAGPDWDHPTGWGSPRAKSLISHLGQVGPSGKLEGVVTDATNGKPIHGAMVVLEPGHYSRITDAEGHYSMVLPTGSYTVEVSEFGYRSQSSSATISDGSVTTLDIQLVSAPLSKVSGHVIDGSGHGYGLYSQIEITTPDYGKIADVWSDPVTGAYSVSLPDGFDYSFKVSAAFPGYAAQTTTIGSLSENEIRNFSLVTTVACIAPGYHFVKGFGAGFDGSFPPDGWSVKTPVANQTVIWKLNKSYGDGNYTGGSGSAAEANSDKAGLNQGPYDTRLVTPPISVTSLPANAVLKFRYQYIEGGGDAFDLGLSEDGGKNWDQVASIDNCGSLYSLPGCNATVNLSSYLPSSGDVMLRWRYHDSKPKPWNWYAQIDDVRIGKCEPIAGGLISGQVEDAVTGKPLTGATVSDELGDAVKTIENSKDSSLPVGFYIMFSPTGKRTLTAEDWHYQSSVTDVVVKNNSTISRNFELKTGRLLTSPAAISASVAIDEQGSASLTLKNIGNAPLHFKLLKNASPPPASDNENTRFLGQVPLWQFEGQPRISLRKCDGEGADCSQVPMRPFVATRAATSAPGAVVSTFDTGLSGVYGLGVDRDGDSLWVGSISASGSGGDDMDHEFLPDGTATGRLMDVSAFSPGGLMGDMAYDYNTGLLWQIGVIGNHFCLFALDPSAAVSANRKICPPINFVEYGLAYDPTTDSWYAGDFNNDMIYHFDGKGRLLGAKNVGIKVIGLTYNSATGHLFALTTVGAHDVFVLDAKDNYRVLSSFDIAGMNGSAGAGLGHDCNGNLWATDLKNEKVYEVRSGETGWCDFKNVSWMSEAPVNGTIAPGASAEIMLSFSGPDQKAGSVTKAAVLVRSDTPYQEGTLMVPVKVNWKPKSDSPPVASDGRISTLEGKPVGGQLKATDPDGDPLTYAVVNGPDHGEVVIKDASTGVFTYSPDSGYVGKDSFTYEASDGELESNEATIDVSVKARSHPSHGSKGGGGGAIGWLTLCGFMCLIIAILLFRHRNLGSTGSDRSG